MVSKRRVAEEIEKGEIVSIHLIASFVKIECKVVVLKTRLRQDRERSCAGGSEHDGLRAF